jgi:MotA/TolQ/ExbB proton channel family
MTSTLREALSLLPWPIWLLLALFLISLIVLYMTRSLIDIPWIAERLQKVFALAPGGQRGNLTLTRKMYVITLLISIVMGLWIYSTLVRHFYANLQEAYLKGNAINDVLTSEPGTWPLDDSQIGSLRIVESDAQKKLLFSLLVAFGLNDSPREATPDSVWQSGSRNYETGNAWRDAWHLSPGDTKGTLNQTVDLLVGLIVPGQTKQCESEYREVHKKLLAAALAGQPANWADASPRRHSDSCPIDQKERARFFKKMEEGVDLGLFKSFSIERPAELSNYQIIRLVRSNWAVEMRPESDARDQFISRLMQELRGTGRVRGARRWVNGIIGWERLLIIVLAVWFVLVYLIRDVMELPHLIHSRLLVADLEENLINKFRSGGAYPAATARATHAETLATRLSGGAMPANPQVFGDVKTIPTRILSSAAAEMRYEDSTFIETIADAERRELNHSRVFFDAMLPTFPAIGFIGTVSSLLVAMSQADKIVSTIDPQAKGIAAGQVTDILSLCFSTTFLALICVLVFSPLSIAQRSREDQLIDDTEAAVQLALRPEQP